LLLEDEVPLISTCYPLLGKTLMMAMCYRGKVLRKETRTYGYNNKLTYTITSSSKSRRRQHAIEGGRALMKFKGKEQWQ